MGRVEQRTDLVRVLKEVIEALDSVLEPVEFGEKLLQSAAGDADPGLELDLAHDNVRVAFDALLSAIRTVAISLQQLHDEGAHR